MSRNIAQSQNQIQDFAEKHRVKAQRDDCGDTIIAGKSGNIFDGYDSALGVCIMHESAKKWGNARRAMEAAGFRIRQNGDTEGIATFAPENRTQARLALKLARVKTRRRSMAPSAAQLAALAAFRGRRR
jgi:hypothetical protein